jgi:hypothetical protein
MAEFKPGQRVKFVNPEFWYNSDNKYTQWLGGPLFIHPESDPTNKFPYYVVPEEMLAVPYYDLGGYHVPVRADEIIAYDEETDHPEVDGYWE